MSVPFSYFGKGMHASAILKRDTHRVRTARPELFAPRTVQESRQDGDGVVTTVERQYVKATAMTGAQRHAFAMKAGG